MFAITERLLLRPGFPEDAATLARTIGECAIVRNLSHVPWPYTLADAERFLAQPLDPRRPHLLMLTRDGAELVGGIGLAGRTTPNLGYWVACRHWGKGFATEAGRALLAACDESLRLPEVRALHAADNPASGAVLQRLGFVAAGASDPVRSAARDRPVETLAFRRLRPAAEHARLAA